MDEVFCKSTNQTYARKIISSRQSPSLAISSEVAILSRLQHPHIIKLVDTWEIRLDLWLLMSPVAKSDLAVYLQQASVEGQIFPSFNRPEKHSLQKWVRCLSSALGYLHENGIVHGDIKPKNILISSDSVVYIGDFGTAKYKAGISKFAAHKFSALTPKYCAPEVFNRQAATLDYAADVFSLGCVWAEMATVYAGQSIQEFEKFRQSGSLDSAFHATIPRTIMWIDALCISRGLFNGCLYEFSKTVKDMLNFDPRKRPTMKELAAQFRCTCSKWPSSDFENSAGLRSRCCEDAGNAVISTSAPLLTFSKRSPVHGRWRAHKEAINSHYSSNNRSAPKIMHMGPWEFNRTFSPEDGQAFPNLLESTTFLDECPALLYRIPPATNFRDNHTMVPTICCLSTTPLICSRIGAIALKRSSALN